MRKTFCINVPGLDLKKTLECGQCFHWVKAEEGEGKYLIGQRDKWVGIKQEEPFGPCYLTCEDGEYCSWFKTLSLGWDPTEFEEKLNNFLETDEISKSAHGVYLIVQDPWEAMVQFLGSAQRTVNQIYQSYLDMTSGLGNQLEDKLYSLPDCGVVAVGDLTGFSLGFRQTYIRSTAWDLYNQGGDNYLGSLSRVGYERASTELQRFNGIGPKIADCICLYGLGYTEAIPVDVQIERALKRLNISVSAIRQEFGKEAGIVQLYLYQWIRSVQNR